jgi:2-alkyl-3-oxoalkanoate reductase
MKLHAGIVGAGAISKFHVQAIRRLEDVEIVGVYDLDQGRAKQLAEELSLASFASLKAMREAGANVIHVLTPPAAHAAVAIEALSLGCHVFVEKPLATSTEDCERIAAAAQTYKREVCVGHSLLFDPLVSRSLEMVRSGAIGEVLTFDYFRCQRPSPYPVTGATGEQQKGGFPFRDLGIHALYLAEAFVGPIQAVDANPQASGRGDCNLLLDEWRVLARCARGTAQIQMSWNVRPQQNLIVVQGTRGILRCDLFGLSLTVKKQRPLPEPATRMVNAVTEGVSGAKQAIVNVARFATGRLWQFHGLQALVGQYYAALSAGRPTPVPADDAVNVVHWTEIVARQADRKRDEIVAMATSKTSGAKTLVTGASGFIGRNLVRRLLRTGEPVRLLVRRLPSPEILDHPMVEVVLGDLGDSSVVDRAVEGMSIVYHVGAAMSGGANDFERATVLGTRNVVESCLRHRVTRLVHMSSLAIIDTDAGNDGRPIDEESALERDPGARGNYTRTKMEAERLVREAVVNRGLPAVILRPGEVVGAEKPLLTPGVAQRIGNLLVVIGNGRLKLPLVHVSDVVDAALAATASDVRAGSVLQLVEDCGVTQADIIAHYRSIGQRYRVIHVPIAVLMALAAVVEVIFKKLGRNAPIGRRRIKAATTQRAFNCLRAAEVLSWTPRAGVRAALSGADESTNYGVHPQTASAGRVPELAAL